MAEDRLPTLTGNPADDEYAIGAGTGGKVSISPVQPIGVGSGVTGATPSALMVTDSSGDIASGPATSSVVTAIGATSGHVPEANGSGGYTWVTPSGGASFTPTGDLGGTSGDTVVETVLGGKLPVASDGTNLPTSVENAALNVQAVQLGNVSGTITCDLSQGVVFEGTVTGVITGVTFTNWPASPMVTDIVLDLTQDSTGHAISLPSVSWLPLGATPTFNVGAGNLNHIPLFSPNQGATLIGDALSGVVAALQTAATNALYVVEQGTNASVARPAVPGRVLWVGSASPLNAEVDDLQAASGLTVLAPVPQFVQESSAATLLSTTASSLSVPISNLPALPNVQDTLLMAVVSNFPVTTGSGCVTDPRGNVWTIDDSSTALKDLAILRTSVATAYQSGDALTVNFSSGSTNMAVVSMAEFTALPPNPVDQTGAAASASTAVTSMDAGATAATSEAVELVISALDMGGSPGSGSSWSGSYVNLTGGGSATYLRWAYYVTSATGAQHGVYTATTAQKYGGLTVAYKAS